MSAPGEVVLGLVRTAGIDLALPLDALREVVPCPTVLADLPVTTTGLLGAMTLRGSVVPVVDLLLLQGREHPRRQDQVVVVVAHGEQLLGVLVDEIRGLASVPPDGFDDLACDRGTLLSSRTFHHPELGHVVSVLDPAALLCLPGVPVVRESASAAGTVVDLAGPARSLTLVRCGSYALAIDVEHVHSTIPSPALTSSVVDGPVCLGMTPVAGYDVPVLDVLSLLGLGTLAGDVLECGLVVDVGDGQVVLGVSSLVGLRDVQAGRVVAVPRTACSSPDLLPAVADVPGIGACLLLDGAALRARADVLALSRMRTDAAEPGQQRTAGVTTPTGPAHLAYRAGLDLATELSQVVEVLAYPEDLVASSCEQGIAGFAMHRGTAVPVVDLAVVLGQQPDARGVTSRLLLVDVDGDPFAFSVGALHAILPTMWSDLSAATAIDGTATGVVRSCPLVQLVTQDRLLPQLDLVALARRLFAAPAVPLAAAG